MLKKHTIALLIILLSIQTAFSQDVKFGKVSKKELEEKFYPLDSSANAAILYKKRRTYYDYNSQNGWILVTKIHERIKIYNKNGNDWATKKISLYKDGDDEKVSIKAYTYNIINNKVEKTKLSNKEIFYEEVNKYWRQKKFTMPNLTEGSVIEWEYSIQSPYYWKIDDMVFQYTIPVKYIDTQVKTPEFFVFKNQSKGFFPINVNRTTKHSNIILNSKSRGSGDRSSNYTSQTTFSQDKVEFQSNIIQCVQKNIPPLIEEPYMNNLENYITALKFEITAYKPKYSTHKYYNNTWKDVTKTIYESSNFGEQLKKTSYFKDDLASLVNMTAPVSEKIAKVFQFVKSKIKWNGYRNKYTKVGVKKAYKDGVGNSAEVNLTLITMLREAGLNANPVLVSTRDHGIPLFPTTEGFNYVIASVETKDRIILLDATEKYSLPNVLPLRALNWQGKIVRKDGSSTSVNLFPKNYSSKKVFLSGKLDSEALITGSCRALYNNTIALDYRNEYNDVSNQDLIGKLEKDNQNIEISKLKVSNEEDLSKSLMHNFTFETEDQVEIIGDKMYFSSLLFLTEKENPFKLENRLYPVDFGAPWEEKYTISIELPEGYTIESKPENITYALPENMGTYKFISILKNNKLQVLSNVKINLPIIASQHYSALKEFYKKMIDKQLEKVVLTKQ
jgi:hypothetical protein